MKTSKIYHFIFGLLVFLIPLFFLPITADFYNLNKNYLLWLLVGLCFLAWGIKSLVNRKIEIRTSIFLLPLFFWVLAAVLSIFFASPNKTEAFFLPNGGGTFLALFFLYWLILNLEEKEKIFSWLTASAFLLSLITIYQYFGLGEHLIPENSPLAFARIKIWSPAGNPLFTATFLAPFVPLALIHALKKKNSLSKSLLLLTALLTATATILAASLLLPGKPAALTLLPYKTGWAIAVETFKQKPLFGVGPVNFVTAFNKFRPADFNQFSFWSTRFGVSSNYFLQVWTETGILGLLSIVFLLVAIFNYLAKSKNWLDFAGILTIFLIWLFLPGNFLLLFLFTVLLGLVSPAKTKFSFQLNPKLRWLPLVVSLLIIVPSFYFAGRLYAAEVYFKKSLDTAAKNDGLKTYNYQIKAIQLNPKRIDFRLAYSQTNWALANSLASNPPSGQLTDQDKNNITQLIQQAINEAKIATSLNPDNALVWENLAQIYRGLINLAQGADQWALTAYQQAILNDPVNPRLRIDLGGLFYALKNYDEAQNIFRIAVELKPDYANAWYNLAAAYREAQKYPQAYQAMQQTLALIPVDSEDWQKAKNELDELAKKLPSPTPTPSPQAAAPEEKKEELTPPQPLPSPVIEPPLELPEEAKPESLSQPTPSPTPTVGE